MLKDQAALGMPATQAARSDLASRGPRRFTPAPVLRNFPGWTCMYQPASGRVEVTGSSACFQKFICLHNHNNWKIPSLHADWVVHCIYNLDSNFVSGNLKLGRIAPPGNILRPQPRAEARGAKCVQP
jgi:hypothetical protein